MGKQLTGSIAFASGKTGDYDIWTCSLATGDVTQLTFGNCLNDKPKWSPDGKWIVFVSNRTGFQEIFKIPSVGGEVMPLTALNRWTDSPTFSPDGKTIAFISNEAGNNDIWIMDANGANPRQVTHHVGSDDYVEWTPDGNGLLWSSGRGQDADIWHYDLISGAKTQLNEDRGADFSPAASPDGALIAFCSNRQQTPNPDSPFDDRDKDIWLMSADGSFPVKLTQNQGADFAPCWSPDGNYLMYTADENRRDCHLRILNVADVAQAYKSGEVQQIESAAQRIRTTAIELDREPLKAEIDAERHATFLTMWLPESWISSCYPPEYFGLERNPHWVGAAIDSSTRELGQPTSSLSL